MTDSDYDPGRLVGLRARARAAHRGLDSLREPLAAARRDVQRFAAVLAEYKATRHIRRSIRPEGFNPPPGAKITYHRDDVAAREAAGLAHHEAELRRVQRHLAALEGERAHLEAELEQALALRNAAEEFAKKEGL